jgi:hypothetical protein
MATVANLGHEKNSALPSAEGGLTAFVDRWIWVFTAALLTVTALTGFVPDSLMKIGMVQAGERPPFPLVMHVHALLMGAWLLLLLTQTTLMATGRRDWHMRLGIAGFVLAPAIVITGIILVPTMYAAAWAGAHAADPALAPDAMPPRMAFQSNILLQQIRVGVLFPVLVGCALLARRRSSGLHKRLMILATTVPMGAAIQRIAWLPSSMPHSPLTLDLFPPLLLAPLFLWDLYRLRRVHRAYLIWFALMVPFVIVARMLWGTPWWLETVPRLMGVN